MIISKKTDKKQVFFKIITFLMMVGWILFIFSLSLQPAVQSSEVSKGLLTKILFLFYSMTKIKVDISAVHNIFRSLAHFTEFFLLGVFSLLFFFSALKSRPVYALATGFITAICDESIQYFFAEGRTMQIEDIAVDFSGVILSSIVFYIVYKFVFKKKTSKNE